MPSGHRPPIPPGYARVTLLGKIFTHQWVNTFYVQLTGSGITSVDLNALAADIAAGWNTYVAPNVSSDCVLTGVAIVYIPSVGNELLGNATVSHAGTNGHPTLPDAGASWVVNWHISAYYRGGHPRWYVAGVSDVYVSNGSDMDTGESSTFNANLTSYRGAINGYTTTNITAVSMGTMSFQTGNAWRGTPLFRAYTGNSIRTKLGSQRRRILS